MDYETWKPQYEQILKDFEFKKEDDERSAAYLSEVIESRKNELDAVDEKDLERLLKDKIVYVFGEGPTLENDVANFDFNGTLIAADGATTALLKGNIVPDIIVSDLDGNIEDQITAVEKGAVILIHAHGDNYKQLNKWVTKFQGKVMGTTQSEPSGRLYNFGGFTDGDRAIFLADHFKASAINLVAFDFLEVGDFKNEEAEKLKLRKLTWANLLIGVLNNPNIEFIPPSDK